MRIIDAGATARSFGRFKILASEAGDVPLANVTCRLLERRTGTEVDLTASIVEDDQETETELSEAGLITWDVFVFHVDYVIPDASRKGKWTFRWECSDPKIVTPEPQTTFIVRPSALASP